MHSVIRKNQAFTTPILMVLGLSACGIEPALESRPINFTQDGSYNDADAEAERHEDCAAGALRLDEGCHEHAEGTETEDDVPTGGDKTTGDEETVQPAPSSSPTPTGDPNIIEFRIAANTGDNPWNTTETMVMGTVGKTLRIFNDDSVSHTLHTNGRPCNHGTAILPGRSFDCVLGRTYDATTNGPIYDHERDVASRFYLRVTQ